MSAIAQRVSVGEIPDWRRRLLSVAKDYWILTKPEVNFLVIASTFAGFYVASRASIQSALLLHTLIGTLLVASGTATLNQYMERAHDSNMRRTGYRPLPSGRLKPWQALSFGMLISVAGSIELWFKVNPLASVLALSTLLSYLLIYTPLKQKTPLCTFIGAFPGAMPPLIGWAAVRGSLSGEAWLLFAILFLWQFPHFLAIAWMYRDDYKRAGFHMLPSADIEGRFTGVEVLTLTVVLIGVSLVPALLRMEGNLYLAGSIVAGSFFLWESAKLATQRTTMCARRVLHASVIYLPVVFGLMIADKIRW